MCNIFDEYGNKIGEIYPSAGGIELLGLALLLFPLLMVALPVYVVYKTLTGDVESVWGDKQNRKELVQAVALTLIIVAVMVVVGTILITLLNGISGVNSTTSIISPANSGEIQGAATIAECVGALATRLKPGMTARVNSANNNAPNILRAEPGIRAKRLASLRAGTTFKIVDGPICASSYWYWKVQTRYGIGWTAEGDSSGYWLELVTDNR